MEKVSSHNDFLPQWRPSFLPIHEFSGLGVAFLWADLANKEAAFLVWVVPTVAVLAFAAFLVSLSRTLLSRILRYVPWQAVKRPAAKLFEAYSVLRSHRTVIAENFLLALLEQSVQIAILLGCAFAIGVEAAPSLLIAVLILSQFLRKLAIVLEGWTLGEFTLVLTCALAGIDETDALTFSLLAHAVQITASLPGGVLFWRNREQDLTARALRREVHRGR